MSPHRPDCSVIWPLWEVIILVMVPSIMALVMSPHGPDCCQLMSLMAPRHSLMTLIGPALQKLRLWALPVPFHTFWSFAKFFMLMNEAFYYLRKLENFLFVLKHHFKNCSIMRLRPLWSFYSHHHMWFLSKFTHAGLSKKLDTELSGNGRKWAKLELFSRVWK